jgi:hypothetical protein
VNRLTRLSHPYPTTILRIVGDADDDLAFHKFAVFALVSCLFNLKAASAFRAMLRNERERKKRHARFVKGYYKKRRQEFKQFGQGERELERLLDMVEGRLFFLHQPRTISTISAARPPFSPPHWVGDPPPIGVDIVPCVSQFPSADEFAVLVRDYGYDGRAAWTSIAHKQLQPPPDRRRRLTRPDMHEQENPTLYEQGNYGSASFAQPFPYVAALPRRTEQGCGFTRRAVEAVVSKMRVDLPTRRAVTKIVYARLPVKTVATAYGIPWVTLKTHAQRVRLRLRTNRQ